MILGWENSTKNFIAAVSRLEEARDLRRLLLIFLGRESSFQSVPRVHLALRTPGGASHDGWLRPGESCRL